MYHFAAELTPDLPHVRSGLFSWFAKEKHPSSCLSLFHSLLIHWSGQVSWLICLFLSIPNSLSFASSHAYSCFDPWSSLLNPLTPCSSFKLNPLSHLLLILSWQISRDSAAWCLLHVLVGTIRHCCVVWFASELLRAEPVILAVFKKCVILWALHK